MIPERLTVLRLRLPALISALLISGCALGRPKPHEKDWRVANVHKVVVVCVQGEQQANRSIESSMVSRFRRQGFDAVITQELFPNTAKFSPKEMLDRIRRAQVDGIMEIVYSSVALDGVPRDLKFKYHSIKGGQAEHLSDRSNSVDAALIELMAGVTR